MSLFHVTFRKSGHEKRRSYKKEIGALRASLKFLTDNVNDPLSVVTLMSPHNPVRVFRCPSEVEIISNKQVDFYSTQRWKSLRFDILLKFGSTCMCCNATKNDGVVIDVDHVYPRCRYPQLEYEPTNLQVLCNPCNQGKLHNKIIDFRSQGYKDELAEKVRELGIESEH